MRGMGSEPIIVRCNVLLPDSQKVAAAAIAASDRRPRIPASILNVFSGLFGLSPDPDETTEAFLERAGRIIGERRARANGESAADWLGRRGQTTRWRP